MLRSLHLSLSDNIWKVRGCSFYSHISIIKYFSEHLTVLVLCSRPDNKYADPEIFGPAFYPNATTSVLISYLGTSFTLEERRHLAKTTEWNPKCMCNSGKNFSAVLWRGETGKNTTLALQMLCSVSKKHEMSGNTVSDKRGVKLSLWVDISMCVFFSSSAFIPQSMCIELQARWNGADMSWS